MPSIRTSKDAKGPGALGARPGEVPIGGIVDWYKNTIGAGSVLPDGWVECNGQVLSDAESPLNGGTIPDINGSISAQQNFRRNGTTASTSPQGNADAVVSVPAISLSTSQSTFTAGGLSALTAVNISNTGSASQGQILPKYFIVVAIMRVK